MISFMPRLYEDEILYSWFSRYHTLNGNLRYYYTMNELFGEKVVSAKIYYPMHLNFLCEELPRKLNYTPEMLIDNHSIIPIFKPFMTKERYARIIHNIKVGGVKSKSLKFQLGMNTGNIFETDDLIKICPECFKEEKKAYGESFIHTEHQIPGISICKKHGIRLYNYKIPKQSMDTFFVNINNCDLKFDENIYINENILNYHKNLCEDIEYILNGGISDYSINEINKKYHLILIEKGYASNNGNVNQKKLEDDFIKYYPKEFLNDMESYIEPGKDRKSWIRLISTNSKRFIHPIRHILFIRFLFGSILEFSKYKKEYKEEYKFFGEPPFPCLNVLCKDYGKLVISECEITKNKPTGKPVGNFKCKTCGFKYARVGPDESKKDMFRIGIIREYGHTWDNKLIELAGKHLSINKIKKEMKCCRNTVVRNAERLGVVDKLNTKQRFIRERHRKIDDKELNKYRNAILNYIKINPTTTRQEVREKLTKECGLLYLRDKKWLENNLPKQFINGRKFTKSSTDIDWCQRDKEIYNIIKEKVDEVYSNNLNVRISKAYLSKFNRCTILSLKKYLSKLPLTSNLLNEVVETYEQYKQRINNYKKVK